MSDGAGREGTVHRKLRDVELLIFLLTMHCNTGTSTSTISSRVVTIKNAHVTVMDIAMWLHAVTRHMYAASKPVDQCSALTTSILFFHLHLPLLFSSSCTLQST